jgi:hypothetical protein
LTFYPAWLWLVVGVAVAGIVLRRRTRVPVALALAAWMLYGCLLVEEPRSLLSLGRVPTSQWADDQKPRTAVRVISLNCAGGDIRAAAEAFRYRPDVILFQESPPAEALQELARDEFGDSATVVSGLDTAIAARGHAVAVPLPGEAVRFATGARALTPPGVEIEFLSVRLVPPVLSLNLLSLDCWQAQAANRDEREEQVAQLGQCLRTGSPESLTVVGGDFNAPQGDGSLAALRPRFRDSFAEGGGGWGNTVTNDFPVLRFDQIWISSGLRAVAVSARRTRHSDHRMVICDLVIGEGEGE